MLVVLHISPICQCCGNYIPVGSAPRRVQDLSSVSSKAEKRVVGRCLVETVSGSAELALKNSSNRNPDSSVALSSWNWVAWNRVCVLLPFVMLSAIPAVPLMLTGTDCDQLLCCCSMYFCPALEDTQANHCCLAVVCNQAHLPGVIFASPNHFHFKGRITCPTTISFLNKEDFALPVLDVDARSFALRCNYLYLCSCFCFVLNWEWYPSPVSSWLQLCC